MSYWCVKAASTDFNALRFCSGLHRMHMKAPGTLHSQCATVTDSSVPVIPIAMLHSCRQYFIQLIDLEAARTCMYGDVPVSVIATCVVTAGQLWPDQLAHRWGDLSIVCQVKSMHNAALASTCCGMLHNTVSGASSSISFQAAEVCSDEGCGECHNVQLCPLKKLTAAVWQNCSSGRRASSDTIPSHDCITIEPTWNRLHISITQAYHD